MKENNMHFGTFNIETGEIQDGYIENGQQKFKKQSFWKRLFQKEPSETKYLGTINLKERNLLFDNQRFVVGAIYKEFNPFTLKTQRIYCKVSKQVIEIDTNAWEKEGKFIEI